ncbi:hypothetical protein C8R44DRAFT_734142 [Mycena epipterygia]|nr:hypothetical protein C8R44DRAFT_734142 [Mycena epipterygia]
MPINIASKPASGPSSAASSPSASSSSSSSGVYIPVHRRTPSNVEAKRTLPIYTPAELLNLAQSPLATQVSVAMRTALHGQEFAMNKRQQRSREYIQRKGTSTGATTNAGALQKENNNVMVVAPVAAPRRRPIGRATERSNLRRGGASKFMDAASWRGQMTRQPAPLAV